MPGNLLIQHRLLMMESMSSFKCRDTSGTLDGNAGVQLLSKITVAVADEEERGVWEQVALLATYGQLMARLWSADGAFSDNFGAATA